MRRDSAPHLSRAAAGCLSKAGSWGEALPGIPPQLPVECIAGLPPQASSEAGSTADDPAPLVVAQWLGPQRWQAGYTQWQRCRSSFGRRLPAARPHPAFRRPGRRPGLLSHAPPSAALPRAAWPSYAEGLDELSPLARAQRLSSRTYNRFTPWPSALLRRPSGGYAAQHAPCAQVLACWPRRRLRPMAAMRRATQGKAVDGASYGALLANAGLELSADNSTAAPFGAATPGSTAPGTPAKLGKTLRIPSCKPTPLAAVPTTQHLGTAHCQLKPSSAAVPATLPPFEQGALNLKGGQLAEPWGEVISLHDDHRAAGWCCSIPTY